MFSSDSKSEITNLSEMSKSGANLPSDQKIDFLKNWWSLAAEFQGRFSLRDLDII